jgi:hypothetical protein
MCTLPSDLVALISAVAPRPLPKLAVEVDLGLLQYLCHCRSCSRGSGEGDPHKYLQILDCDAPDDYLVVGGYEHKVGRGMRMLQEGGGSDERSAHAGDERVNGNGVGISWSWRTLCRSSGETKGMRIGGS